MPDRRSFLRSSMLAAASAAFPFAATISKSDKPEIRMKIIGDPVLLSTWNHGIPANEKAWQVLNETGSIVDAVEQGVRVIENDPDNLSVGLQGLPDRDGIVTLDASIMKGDGSCGSVAFVRQVKHPISLARLVMDETPHVMIAGEGARKLAAENGFELQEEELSPRAEEAYEKWLEQSEYKPVINIENHDTIGMIGIDGNGKMAGSCTTSGLAYKMHGRVGDSPIIGAGLYVDDEVGAATATGLGESIIRICGSFLIVELMRQGRTPQEACEEAVRRLISKHDNVDDIQAGFLALNKDGEAGAYAVQPGFNYALHNRAGNELVDSGSMRS
ncbi:isoaspartyl peptidase/L-asparaginase family protein [Rhodohalobacter mucosus]|uniref:Glycosylasparaginase n=1 Tax=Rhodohalobacter mucosus TaxID=2079485 RepID=A0A316TPW8_9BACT|nr:N(4)-(beta-N-acetylglucosaminyl)-L-asparaginase [Rhodohalobacter mucosus]PWN05858.1 glycosylasparaginase [Rhodohalobacter mucosus]